MSSVKLQIYFSDFFQIPPEVLDQWGAFDISLINDLPLFIDPFLLFNSDKPAYQELHKQIIKYLRFLRSISAMEGIKRGLIGRWYRFAEVRQTWLGYSSIGNQGRGLGDNFAQALHRNLHSVFSQFGTEEITRSSHLEKLCLIEHGVGRDNISDFTTNLIKKYLLEYTEAFARQYIAPVFRGRFVVDKVEFNYETRTWQRGEYDLPCYLNDFVLLTPKDILTRDETWINNADFRNPRTFTEIVEALPNEQLRDQINEYLARAVSDDPNTLRRKNKEEKERATQAAINTLISRHPELIDHYVRHKEEHEEEATAISEQKVELAETVFIAGVRALTGLLYKMTSFYHLAANSSTYEETHARIAFLKDVVENKGGHRMFYFDGEPFRREADLQVLFRLVWFASPSEVTREANDGRGPVDFKIARGAGDKTLVEFKLASNSQLKRNLERQAEIYQNASDAEVTIKVVFYFSDEELKKVQTVLEELGLFGNKDVVLVDARADNKPSGSKA